MQGLIFSFRVGHLELCCFPSSIAANVWQFTLSTLSCAGLSSNTVLNDMYGFDLASWVWTKLAAATPAPGARSNVAFATGYGRIYLFGGNGGAGHQHEICCQCRRLLN